MAESGKWSCDRCQWDRLSQLEVKLENALQQIEVLKQKKKEMEEQLQGAVAGCEASWRHAVRKQREEAECLVLADSIIQNVESEHVRVRCFPVLEPNSYKE
jgi:hypothetical protein